MGPELGGTSLLLEDSNITEMLAIHRERGGADDEDCIYIHDSGGSPVILRRTVLAHCDDDALDLLGGALTVDDCIIRNAFDKGVSLLDNDVVSALPTSTRQGFSTKCFWSGHVLLNTPGMHDRQRKNPTTTRGQLFTRSAFIPGTNTDRTMNITVNVKNCLVSAEEPVRTTAIAGTPFPR